MVHSAGLLFAEQAQRDKTYDLTGKQAQHRVDSSQVAEKLQQVSSEKSSFLTSIFQAMSAVRAEMSKIRDMANDTKLAQLNDKLEELEAKRYAMEAQLKNLEEKFKADAKRIDDTYQQEKTKLEMEIKTLDAQIETQRKLRDDYIKKTYQFRINNG